MQHPLFHARRKVLIGVVHLRALPGAPRWKGDLASVIKLAVNDARAYERGGAHAVFIENFGDVPFTKGSVGPETIAAMAVAGPATPEGARLPLGLNFMRNDPPAPPALSAPCPGDFIRPYV